MNNRFLVPVLMGALSAPSFAFAEFYAAIAIGNAEQRSDFSLLPPSGDDLSTGLRIGYYLNPHVTAELAYHDYGKAEDHNYLGAGILLTDEMETSALSIGLKGMIPVSDVVSITGHLGISKWEYDLTSTASFLPMETFKDDDSGTDPYIGIGVQYELSDKAFVALEHVITEMGVSASGESIDHDVKNTALVLGITF